MTEDRNMKNNHLLGNVCNRRGLAKLAGGHVLPDQTPPFQRGAGRWFKTRKIMLVLAGVLVASVCHSPSLHAAIITFAAGDVPIGPGGVVNVPITVSGFSDVIGAGFSLSWTSGVLQYVGTGNYNSTLAAAGLNASCFSFVNGNVGFTWTDTLAPGQTLTDGTTIFILQFTAVGGPSSPVTFVDNPTLREALFYNGDDLTPGHGFFTVDGQVTVVPEPVNLALGLFACVFIGGAMVRWVSNPEDVLAGYVSCVE